MIYTWFSHHQGVVTLRRIGCLDTYGLDLWLRWLGLLLLILSVVILIVFWSKFSRYLAVEGGKFGFVQLQLILLAPTSWA